MMPSRRKVLKAGLSGAVGCAASSTWAFDTPGEGAPLVDIYDPRFELYFNAREEFWSGIGTVEDDWLSYIVSPELRGLPAWPTTSQAYRLVRTPKSVIIASEGLSDLFIDTSLPDPGFGCEVYLESPELVDADMDAIRASWQFAAIENFAQNVAHFGGINALLDKYGMISMELPAPDNMPEDWVTKRGSVGVLINMEVEGRPSRCQLEEGVEIRIISITTLLPDEVAHAIDGKSEAREDLARRLIGSGNGLVSPESRASVLA